ncbi:cation:proton antiporter subunit C [Thermodesulfovibrionales bacterium]|nr:cation:proton antiporter subunit C [Thermodesulfovibrionales bacterium]
MIDGTDNSKALLLDNHNTCVNRAVCDDDQYQSGQEGYRSEYLSDGGISTFNSHFDKRGWDLPDPVPYVNPLPHVMILTAIVVGVSITAVALALVIRINIAYGTIDEDEIARIEQDS